MTSHIKKQNNKSYRLEMKCKYCVQRLELWDLRALKLNTACVPGIYTSGNRRMGPRIKKKNPINKSLFWDGLDII